MKEQSKNRWLLPLGIGAGVLLLIAGVKKKANAASATPGAEAAGSVISETQEPTAPGQINPMPAPSYSRSTLPQRTNTARDTDAWREITQDEEDALPANSEQASFDTGYGSEEQDIYRNSSNEEDEASNDDSTDSNTEPLYASTKQQGYHPVNTSNALPSNMSVAYRPGAYNSKQKRFDNTAHNGRNKHSIKAYADPSAKQSAHKPLLKTTQKPSMRNQPAISSKPSMRVTQPVPVAHRKVVSPAAARPVRYFPLRIGSSNIYVKELQHRIGVSATGYFGTATLAAIRKRYGLSEVSETMYKQIISGKAVLRKLVSKTFVRQKPVKRQAIVARQPVPAQKNK